MVPFYVTTMAKTCSSMIGHIIVGYTDKQW